MAYSAGDESDEVYFVFLEYSRCVEDNLDSEINLRTVENGEASNPEGWSDSNPSEEDALSSSWGLDVYDQDGYLDDVDLSHPHQTVAELLREIIESLDDAIDQHPMEIELIASEEGGDSGNEADLSNAEEDVELPDVQTEDGFSNNTAAAAQSSFMLGDLLSDDTASSSDWILLDMSEPGSNDDNEDEASRRQSALETRPPMHDHDSSENREHAPPSTDIPEEDYFADDEDCDYPSPADLRAGQTLAQSYSENATLPEWYHDSHEHTGRWEVGRQVAIRWRAMGLDSF